MAIRSVEPAHAEGTLEERRGAQGKLELVLTRTPGDSGDVFALHARIRPGARSFGRQFREGDALRLLGFVPRPECRLYPVACFYGGCYCLVLEPTADEAAVEKYHELFDGALAGLGPAVDGLVQAAWAVEDLGLSVRI